VFLTDAGLGLGGPSRRTRMRSIALEAILEAAIGVSDPARTQAPRDVLPKTVEIDPTAMPMWVVPGLKYVGHWRRHRQRVAEANRLPGGGCGFHAGVWLAEEDRLGPTCGRGWRHRPVVEGRRHGLSKSRSAEVSACPKRLGLCDREDLSLSG
jgi:hypothetical protein